MANILSVFDGMACGYIAMLLAGVQVDRYVAYEIDRYAVKTSQHNFPNIEHKGDVFDADFTEYKGFDFLVGGSPCTYWSIAQKNNRETVASGMGWELFQQYVRALHEAEPKYFIYENNKSMSPAIRQSISDAFGFEPVLINSSLVSAQNRNRLYWVGIRNDDGTYRQVNVEQPKDRLILLRDILDSGCALFDKSYTIAASYYKGAGTDIPRQYGGVSQRGDRSMVAEPIKVGSLPRPNGELSTSQAFKIYSQDGKSATLCANGGGSGGKTGLYAIRVMDGREQKLPIYKVENGQIEIKGRLYPIKLDDGFYIIRKLSVSECMRLQTVPDWYEFPVSNTQAYKMLGNGWTVEVIVHLINSIRKESVSNGRHS